jgi:phosphoglycolate phosphatase
MIRTVHTLVFDFDYTLADSSKGVILCVNHALERLGFPPADAERIKRTIGLPLKETFRRLTGREDPNQEREFVLLYVQRADEIVAGLTFLFPFVPETLRALKKMGLSLGILSNKFRRRIVIIMERERLLDYFGVIIGSEDIPRHKPDPESLLTAIQRMNGTPASALYVGDSVTDAETAKRAEVPFVAVLSGVTPKEDFKEYPFHGIISNLAHLPDLIKS